MIQENLIIIGWVTTRQDRMYGQTYVIFVGKVFLNRPDESLPEATRVNVTDHMSAVSPVTLVLPE